MDIMVSRKMKMIISAIIVTILIIALIILIIFLAKNDNHDDHSYTAGILIYIYILGMWCKVFRKLHSNFCVFFLLFPETIVRICCIYLEGLQDVFQNILTSNCGSSTLFFQICYTCK